MYSSAAGAVERSTDEPSSSSTSRREVRTRSESVCTTIPGSARRELVAARFAAREAFERFLLAHRPDAARHALAARLVLEELGDPEHRIDEVRVLVEDHHDARAERRPGGARVLEGQRQIELLRADE